MRWVWVGGHPDWQEGEWRAFLSSLVDDVGIQGVNLGGGPAEVGRVAPWAVQLGLVVHAWMWTLCRPTDAEARAHPDWYQVSGSGESTWDRPPYVDYYRWLCPSHPDVVDHLVHEADLFAQIPSVAAVHLDYVRFPDVILASSLQPKYDIVQDREYPRWDFCYCARCTSAFRAESGVDVLHVADPSALSAWKQFRYDRIAAVVAKIHAQVGGVRAKRLSAAVFPHPDLARFICRQSWDTFRLDALFPMVYHSFYEEDLAWIGSSTKLGVEALRRRASAAATTPPPPLYTGLYLPAFHTERDLTDAIRTAEENGAAGVSFFDAENLKEHHRRAIQKTAREEHPPGSWIATQTKHTDVIYHHHRPHDKT